VLLEELSLLEALEDLEFSRDKGLEEKARLEAELKAVQGRLDEADARLAATREQLEDKQGSVRAGLRRLVAARKVGGVLTALEGDEALNARKTRRYFNRLLAANRSAINEYQGLARVYQAAQAERARDLARHQETQQQLDQELAAIEEAIATRREILARIEREEGLASKYQAEKAAAAKGLKEQIKKLKEWREQRLGFSRTRGQLLYPLQPARVVTRWGLQTSGKATGSFSHGVQFEARPSAGADVTALKVRAIFWGKVVYVGWVRGYGKTVIVDHSDGYHSVYAHLRDTLVKEGDVLSLRQAIGTLDSTRDDEGRLLYFEIRKGGNDEDPGPWFNK
jgi:septal ring factor EnvC (AmiA/AmiB activator)